MELIPFTYDGVSYLRLGSKDAEGNISWSGELWKNKNGQRGAFQGILNEDETDIDREAEEPSFE